jgi:hypothetical protein
MEESQKKNPRNYVEIWPELAIEADSTQYLTVLKLVLWDETLSPWNSYIFT